MLPSFFILSSFFMFSFLVLADQLGLNFAALSCGLFGFLGSQDRVRFLLVEMVIIAAD